MRKHPTTIGGLITTEIGLTQLANVIIRSGTLSFFCISFLRSQSAKTKYRIKRENHAAAGKTAFESTTA
jgi:hypothetical protein